jgi:ADP-ribosylglycohydrolase
MDNMLSDMAKDALYGTLVADALGMGLHWIYSQGKIASIVKKNDGVAEFLEPNEENYKGVPSFFAHPTRSPGDGSNYSEYLYIMSKSIDETGFSAGDYIRNFSDHFGVGGAYVGYADGPMRETIYNITSLSKNLKKRVLETESPLSQEKQGAVAHYISRYFFEYDVEGLKDTVKGALKLHEFSKDEMAQVDNLVDAVTEFVGAIGPDDDQMPALSRSVFLADLYSGNELETKIDQAVRITNNNDLAVAYSIFMARILKELYTSERPQPDDVTKKLRALIETHKDVLPETSRKLIDQALSYNELDYRSATKTFGAACHVDMAIPLSIHILMHTSSFREANRINIMASGDNCGRAIFLGALAGALYGVGGERGVPEEWIARTKMVRRV